MSSYALLLLSLLYIYFIDRCLGKPCEDLLFETTDGDNTKWGTKDSAQFNCLRSLTTGERFSILSPAIHRKPTEKFITVWIWAQSPLNNEPFSAKKKTERVLIPTNPLDWKAPWYQIIMRLDESFPKGIKIYRALKVKLPKEKDDKDVECVSIEDFGTGELKALLASTSIVKGGTLSDLKKAIDSDEGAPSKGHGEEIVAQLMEYIDSLFRIVRDIGNGKLHETVMTKHVILTHPFHSRADNNKWIVAHYKHDSNIIMLPFIGKSKASESPKEAFSPESIAKSGIELDTAVQTNLKFGKFSEFGLPFILKTAFTPPATEQYEIYWYPQVFGGCVLHSLRSTLQKDGVELLEAAFNKYAIKIAKPCSYCGATAPEIDSPHSRYQKNIHYLKLGQHCRNYEYCSAEVYLMEHHYGVLQLNMKEIDALMQKTKRGLVGTGATIDEKNIFQQIMGGAFKKLFKSDIAPRILFVAGGGHAWTYLKMTTLCDPDGYWLSLDSNNGGARRLSDIAEEIKRRLGTPGDGYIIYAVYPPKGPELHKIVNLWIPQKLKPDTCDGDTRNVFDYNALTDVSVFPIYFLCFLLLSICLSLVTIAGCICGYWGDDVLNKTLIQHPTRVTIHK